MDFRQIFESVGRQINKNFANEWKTHSRPRKFVILLTTIPRASSTINQRERERREGIGVQPKPHAPRSIGHSKFTPLPSGGRGLDVVNPEMMLKKHIIKGARVKKKKKDEPSKERTFKRSNKDHGRREAMHGKVDCSQLHEQK
jgi:hypothetical protein